MGTNVFVGTDPTGIARAADVALDGTWAPVEIPLWDGQTATRIAKVLLDDMVGR